MFNVLDFFGWKFLLFGLRYRGFYTELFKNIYKHEECLKYRKTGFYFLLATRRGNVSKSKPMNKHFFFFSL